MARWGSVDYSQLVKFRDKLKKLQSADIQKFQEDMVKELAARLLRVVVKNTDTGIYDKPVNFTTKDGKEVSFTPNTGKKGGTLKRGWTAKTEEEARSGGNKDIKTYVNSLPIGKVGNVYTIEIVNPVEYALYYEYGHRTANHGGWVAGKFVLTIAEKDLQNKSDRIVQQKLERLLRGVFDGQ